MASSPLPISSALGVCSTSKAMLPRLQAGDAFKTSLCTCSSLNSTGRLIASKARVSIDADYDRIRP